ncbi:MAG: UDP-N-acetylmuramoyl-L-alanyl-D-glutamate--2,6-diaminopimelate ligase [Candidatus Omnitrophota bacterium]
MRTLGMLLRGMGVSIAPKALTFSVSGIACDSKQVRPGHLFVAIKGSAQDGASYIPEALARGAIAVVTERDFPSDAKTVKILVKDARQTLAVLCDRYYGSPSSALRVIGITGTNGKTTTSYLIASILKEAGHRVGIIGTIGHQVGDRLIPTQNTTPGLHELQALLAQMVQARADYAAVEVSSHALDQRRVEGIRFRAAVFTNLTQDHLDYHRTKDAYFRAKRRLFESLEKGATAVLNADDPYSDDIAKATQATSLTYGLRNKADIFTAPDSIQMSLGGLSFEAVTPQGLLSIRSSLIGLHNVYNLLAAIGIGISEGIASTVIQEGLFRLKEVPGRLEKIDAGQPFHVFVDFAHTEDALRATLSSLRKLASGRILVVFGCGGDRDRSKRPKMAEAVASFSHWAVVTSDNPRSENPQAILKEVEVGFPASFSYCLEEDRARAIEKALLAAEPGDIVLVAGKGHEAYQVFKNHTVPFDDRKIVYEILSRSRYSESHGRTMSSGRC